MTVENNTKKTVATTDGLAGTADPVTSTMQLFPGVPGFPALSFATAAAFGAFSLMLPVIPLAVILTTGSDTLAGATTMVFMAVTVATQLVTNRIIRRYGYRRVMLAAAFLLGVPTLWYLVSMDTASLLLVAAVRGSGGGAGSVLGLRCRCSGTASTCTWCCGGLSIPPVSPVCRLMSSMRCCALMRRCGGGRLRAVRPTAVGAGGC